MKNVFFFSGDVDVCFRFFSFSGFRSYLFHKSTDGAVCSKRSFFYWGRSENFRRSNNISTFPTFSKVGKPPRSKSSKVQKLKYTISKKFKSWKITNITFENVQKFKKFKCWNYNIGKVEKVEKVQKLIFCSQKSSKVQKLKFGRQKSWKSWKVGCQSGLAKENAWLVAPLRFSPMAAVEGWGAAPLGAAPRPSAAAEAHWSFHYCGSWRVLRV